MVNIKLEYALGNKRIRKFKVICQFSKNKLWHIDTAYYSLNHEQKHFDLAEIYLSMLRAKLEEKKTSIDKNNPEEIKVLYHDYMKMLIEEQS